MSLPSLTAFCTPDRMFLKGNGEVVKLEKYQPSSTYALSCQGPKCVETFTPSGQFNMSGMNKEKDIICALPTPSWKINLSIVPKGTVVLLRNNLAAQIRGKLEGSPETWEAVTAEQKVLKYNRNGWHVEQPNDAKLTSQDIVAVFIGNVNDELKEPGFRILCGIRKLITRLKAVNPELSERLAKALVPEEKEVAAES